MTKIILKMADYDPYDDDGYLEPLNSRYAVIRDIEFYRTDEKHSHSHAQSEEVKKTRMTNRKYNILKRAKSRRLIIVIVSSAVILFAVAAVVTVVYMVMKGCLYTTNIKHVTNLIDIRRGVTTAEYVYDTEGSTRETKIRKSAVTAHTIDDSAMNTETKHRETKPFMCKDFPYVLPILCKYNRTNIN
ncbi:unnamed protein product [Owenia fusiformis]|uniref:Uncharacterized protein n=1 Tax=Owenia fusiformis TaxID=6347 RepID=A0A8S4Q6D3_OWEFU|nr:unnamed protein product [Owenia fusiformis]